MSTPSTPLVILYAVLGLVGFAAFFVGLWIGICTLLSMLSGWSRLARTYAAQGDVQGRRFSGVSAAIGSGPNPVRYSSALTVIVNDAGMRIELFALLRYRSPPLFAAIRRSSRFAATRALRFARRGRGDRASLQRTCWSEARSTSPPSPLKVMPDRSLCWPNPLIRCVPVS